MKRRSLMLLAAVCLGGALPATAQTSAGNYPQKPIRMIMPYAAGGLSDKVVRTIAEELQRTHNMTIVVENRTGGNTVPAALAVTKAAPDGYTIGWFAGATFTTVPLLVANVSYKPEELQPVFLGFQGPLVLAVANNVPASNVKEYVAWVKAQGKPALVGATAKGGSGHLMAEALGLDAKLSVEAVAYRGAAPAIGEMLGGQLPAMFDILDTFLVHHQAKKLKIIGLTSKKRLGVVPEVSTFEESGYADVRGQFWQGLFAPAGTPPEVVNLLYQRFNEVFKSPAVQARLSPDLEVIALNPKDASAYVAREQAYWQSVIKSTKVKMD
jgi:tripartite-type tricarboxylate transporter receptor subunit TctC